MSAKSTIDSVCPLLPIPVRPASLRSRVARSDGTFERYRSWRAFACSFACALDASLHDLLASSREESVVHYRGRSQLAGKWGSAWQQAAWRAAYPHPRTRPPGPSLKPAFGPTHVRPLHVLLPLETIKPGDVVVMKVVVKQFALRIHHAAQRLQHDIPCSHWRRRS